MDVEVMEARDEDLPVVRNLVRFYIYDLSEIMGWDCPEDGLFGGCDDLPQYWGREPDDPEYKWPPGQVGYAFVVRVDGRLGGFALVRRLGERPAPSYDMGDFFILRRYRRRGVGKRVAHGLFDRFPGKWLVRQMKANHPARAFWRKVIAEYTAGDYSESAEHCERRDMKLVVQRFSSSRGSGD